MQKRWKDMRCFILFLIFLQQSSSNGTSSNVAVKSSLDNFTMCEVYMMMMVMMMKMSVFLWNMRALYLSIIENVCIFRLYLNAYISWLVVDVGAQTNIFKTFQIYSSTQRRLFAYTKRERENRILLLNNAVGSFKTISRSFEWPLRGMKFHSRASHTLFGRTFLILFSQCHRRISNFSVKTISLHTISFIYIQIDDYITPIFKLECCIWHILRINLLTTTTTTKNIQNKLVKQYGEKSIGNSISIDHTQWYWAVLLYKLAFEKWLWTKWAEIPVRIGMCRFLIEMS